jgi:uncharacterized MAPEG superfamily protein
MNNTLTTEISWLVATVLMTSLFWVPYILNRFAEKGILVAIWDPQGMTQARAAWADRMMRAHKNAIENLMIFAPLVIVVQQFNLATDATAIAAMVYFYARLVHFTVFTLAIPVLRVASFLVGFGAQMVLVAALL